MEPHLPAQPATPTRAWAWGTAAALLAGGLLALPLAGMPSLFMGLLFFGTVLLLPLAVGGYHVARRRVGIEPTPLVATILGRSTLPPRAVVIPGVAVAVAVGALAYNFLLTPITYRLLGEDLPQFSPVFLSGAEFLLLNTITVTEEVAFRLGVLFLLAGAFGARATPDRRVAGVRVWAALVVSGLLFGLMHVVNAAVYGYGAAPFAIFSLTSQGVVGIAFGWVAWRWGVESAWLAHIAFNLFVMHLARLFYVA